MKWTSSVSDAAEIREAVAEVSKKALAALGERPSAAFIFVSRHHAPHYEEVGDLVRERLGDLFLLGCSAGGVIGAGREIENRPGFSLTAAVLPGVDLLPIRCEQDDVPDLDSSPRTWHECIGAPPGTSPHFVLLPDPFSFDIELFSRGLDYAYPSGRKVGGLASAAHRPGENALYLNREIFRRGMVGVAMSGAIELDTIVAQGCRPIGGPVAITRCRSNVIEEIEGQSPVDFLRALYDGLPERDRALFQNSLFLGFVMDEFQTEFSQGDFLIRNVIGMDPGTGHIAIGAMLRDRQIVQFHLRDAETSAEDLRLMLERYSGARDARGSLLFSCLGRGSYLYGVADHDTSEFRKTFGDVPLGGFFCNGEIGPVRGTTFVHGYTSAFGIFREKI